MNIDYLFYGSFTWISFIVFLFLIVLEVLYRRKSFRINETRTSLIAILGVLFATTLLTTFIRIAFETYIR